MTAERRFFNSCLSLSRYRRAELGGDDSEFTIDIIDAASDPLVILIAEEDNDEYHFSQLEAPRRKP